MYRAAIAKREFSTRELTFFDEVSNGAFTERLWRVCGLAVLLVWLSLVSNAHAEEPRIIYFYSPEVSATRNVVLKTAFDQYLQEKGAYQFQPVANKESFEKLIIEDPHAVFMMSHGHFNRFENSNFTLSQILSGTKSGQNTYRKILVGKKESVLLNELTIASSGGDDYTRDLLLEMFPEQARASLSGLRILRVPKDIDALMAVGFGLADAALASEFSVETLSTLYAKQYRRLHTLGSSEPIQRLVVAIRSDSDFMSKSGEKMTSTELQMFHVLAEMRLSEKGRYGLNMLGLDDWMSVSGKPRVGQLDTDKKEAR